MSLTEYTMIKISKETHLRILENAKKSETFDQYINRLMDNDG